MNTILGKIRKLFTRAHQYSKNAVVRPHRDWHILLFVFLILMIVTIFTHYLLFLSLSKGEIVNNPTAPGPKLKSGVLIEVADRIEKKENRHNTFIDSPRPILTP